VNSGRHIPLSMLPESVAAISPKQDCKICYGRGMVGKKYGPRSATWEPLVCSCCKFLSQEQVDLLQGKSPYANDQS